MIDPEIQSKISALFSKDPMPWHPMNEPILEIAAISWLFPYESELNLLDLEARDEKMIDLQAQAQEVVGDSPYVVYKGGDFMWVHSELSISDRIVLLDSENMFDILRFEGTQGNNHPLSTPDLVETLQTIHSRYGIKIVGAADRAVEFTLLRAVPLESESDLSQKIIEICPDVQDDFRGFNARRVVLYWD
jgi:hypothetical protein